METTAQEIFDTVYHHFITNNEPRSVDDHGACKYRDCEGHKCAVGVVVTDEECTGWDNLRITQSDGVSLSKHSLDWLTPSNIVSTAYRPHVTALNTKGKLPERLKPHVRLLSALQTIHDYDRITEEKFKLIASHFDLAMPIRSE